MNVLIKDYGFVRMKLTDVMPGIGGSRRFENMRTEIKEHVEFIRRAPRQVGKSFVDHASIRDEKVQKKRSYGMNVSYFKRKAIAYGLLNQSMRFLAFYTVSFPKGIDDDIAYKIWNIALTRLRRGHGLKSYLWVMERQKNGTVHFHMLTNDYMRVTDFNRMVAISIDAHVIAGNCSWGNSSLSRYNGVDVKNINRNIKNGCVLTRSEIVKNVIRYLAKYMSKDLRSETHRVWHCSRLVSALYISVAVDEWDMQAFIYETKLYPDNAKLIKSEFFDIILFNMIDHRYWQDTVVKANNLVYDYFEKNDLW